MPTVLGVWGRRGPPSLRQEPCWSSACSLWADGLACPCQLVASDPCAERAVFHQGRGHGHPAPGQPSGPRAVPGVSPEFRVTSRLSPSSLAPWGMQAGGELPSPPELAAVAMPLPGTGPRQTLASLRPLREEAWGPASLGPCSQPISVTRKHFCLPAGLGEPGQGPGQHTLHLGRWTRPAGEQAPGTRNCPSGDLAARACSAHGRQALALCSAGLHLLVSPSRLSVGVSPSLQPPLTLPHSLSSTVLSLLDGQMERWPRGPCPC